MRVIPVDTTGALVMVAQDPRPKLKDRRTGEVATDAETGATLMTLDVTFVANGEAEVMNLTVPETGLPEGLMPGMPIKLTALVARPWANEFNGEKRSGIAFRASAVTVANFGGKG
jgi:hypothetical protein